MANEEVLGPRKTMFVLVIVVGCFAVLWPRILSPLILGHTREQLKPNQYDREAGCCEVLFEKEVALLELLNEVCSSVVHVDGKLSPYAAAECRRTVNETCGVDIAAFIKRDENVGKTTKKLLETMKTSNSSCLKEHFGLPQWTITNHVALNSWTLQDTVKQERPPMRVGPHPALKERGRAIPPGTPPPTRVAMPPHVRPPPIPGMRPPLGSPGGPVATPKSSMGFVMPIYTICIIVFFVYTLSKILFKRTGSPVYESVAPDPQFRRRVFRDDSRISPDKLVVTAISGLVAEVQQQMEASYAQNQQRQDLQDNHARPYTNGKVLHNTGPVHIVTSEYREKSKEKTPDPTKEPSSKFKESELKDSSPVLQEQVSESKEPKESTPETREFISEPKESTPEPKESTPEPKEATPEPKESTLEPKESTPEPKDSSPEPKESTQVQKEYTSEPKESTPEPKELNPEPIESTPEPKESTPEPNLSTPERKEPTLEPKETTSECILKSTIELEKNLLNEPESILAAEPTESKESLPEVKDSTEISKPAPNVDIYEQEKDQNGTSEPIEIKDKTVEVNSKDANVNLIKLTENVESVIEDTIAKSVEDFLNDAKTEVNSEPKQSTPELLEEALKEDSPEKDSANEEDGETATVKVVGMEMTAHSADGGAWRPPPAPVTAPAPRPHVAEEVKAIFLEGEIPQQSRVLVADFEDRAQEKPPTKHSPMVVSGKMTLSLIQDEPRDTPERDLESTVDDFTTASAFTQPAGEKEDELSDEEVEEEIEIEEIEEEVEETDEEEEKVPKKPAQSTEQAADEK